MRIVIVILVALAGYAFLRRRSIRVGPQARKLVESGAILLDVRTPAEFAAGHIEGALNIPVQELEQWTSPQRIGEVARAAGIKTLVLSQIPPIVEQHRSELVASVRRSFAGEVRFAEDGLHISRPRWC